MVVSQDEHDGRESEQSADVAPAVTDLQTYSAADDNLQYELERLLLSQLSTNLHGAIKIDSMTTQEIRELQASIDQSTLRRATELTMAEKFKLGADLFDDGIRWLKQIVKAEQPDLSDDQINQEIDRRRAIKRRIEEQGLYQVYVEETLSGEV
jgi:hypothetical protein